MITDVNSLKPVNYKANLQFGNFLFANKKFVKVKQIVQCRLVSGVQK